ncbi:hypothetical protein [Paenibacillus sp. PastM-2]|uniref:hypothetical protein n=1 Tax=Paenibacillus sp. PastM-2 TaxID=2940533 RepID=UPI0024071CDE|nr:hypothetical protein [Paenibacillus sp. PastM-2]MDF9846468.1 hypothetical protein [Paenibacillus sp. PastM-2]
MQLTSGISGIVRECLFSVTVTGRQIIRHPGIQAGHLRLILLKMMKPSVQASVELQKQAQPAEPG